MSDGIREVKVDDLDFGKMAGTKAAAASGNYESMAVEYFGEDDKKLYVEQLDDGNYLLYEDNDGELVPMSFVNAEGLKDYPQASELKGKLEKVRDNVASNVKEALTGTLNGNGATSNSSNGAGLKEKVEDIKSNVASNVKETLTGALSGNSTTNNDSLVGTVAATFGAKATETIKTPEFLSELSKQTNEQLAGLEDGSPNYKYEIGGKEVSFVQYTDGELKQLLNQLGDTNVNSEWKKVIETEQSRRQAVQHIDLPDNRFVETYDGGETMIKYENTDSGLIMLPNAKGENFYTDGSFDGAGGKF